MKTRLLHIALFVLLCVNNIFAQDVTTVRANNTDISDNLDLRAVATIFGESSDLEDFERRLNDPDLQISNLDLNGDNYVDYIRVIEATQSNTHLIILQSVLGPDTYQDIATVEVERSGNDVQVQVVGDVYMYGTNYIYEPVYVTRPVIFDVFWAISYRPYYSPWYWGYYPTYYSYWAPYPVYRYRNHVHVYVNVNNTCNYVTTRRSSRAVSMHSARRSNGYERMHPDRSFATRTNSTNRYALEQSRENVRVERSSTASRNSYNNSSRSTADYSRGRSINSARTDNNGNVRTTTPSRSSSVTTPSRNSNQGTTTSRGNSNVVRSNPSSNNSRSYDATPSRSSSPSVRTQAPSSSRNSSPSVRSSLPSRSSSPSVRSTPSSSRSSAPNTRSSSPSRSSSPGKSSNGRNSRG